MFKTFDHLTTYLEEKFGKNYLVLSNLPMFTIYLDLVKDINSYSEGERAFYNECMAGKAKIEECFKLARVKITKDLQLKAMHVNVLFLYHVFNKQVYAGRVDITGLKTIKLSRQFLDKLLKENDMKACVDVVTHEYIHAFHLNLPKHVKGEIEADFNKMLWEDEDPSVIFFRKFDTYFQYYWNKYKQGDTDLPKTRFNNTLNQIDDPNINKILNARFFAKSKKKFLIYFWNVLDIIAREMVNKVTASLKQSNKTEYAEVSRENTQLVYDKLMIIFGYSMVKLIEIYLTKKSKLSEVGKYPSSYLLKANKHVLSLFPEGELESSIGKLLLYSVFGSGIDLDVSGITAKGRSGARPYSSVNEYEYAATAGDSPQENSPHQRRISRILQSGERPTRRQEKLYGV
jgi:hypothetical protein